MKLSDFLTGIVVLIVIAIVFGGVVQCTSYLTGGTVMKDAGGLAKEFNDGMNGK